MNAKRFDDIFDKKEVTLFTRVGKHKDWAFLYALKYALKKEVIVNLVFNEKVYKIDYNRIIDDLIRKGEKINTITEVKLPDK